MNCPKCGFDNKPAAAYCGGCGSALTAPVQLQVRSAHPATAGHERLLEMRLTNPSVNGCEVQVTSSCATLLQNWPGQRLSLPPGATVPANSLRFHTDVDGAHEVQFRVETNAVTLYGGTSVVVASRPGSAPVISVTNNGGYMIGDFQIGGVVAEGAGPWVPVDLYLERPSTFVVKHAFFGARQGMFQGHLFHGEPTPVTRVRLQCSSGGGLQTYLVCAGPTIRLGRHANNDVRLLCHTDFGVDESRSEAISRFHAQLDLASDVVSWIDDSTVGTSVTVGGRKSSPLLKGVPHPLNCGMVLDVAGALKLHVEAAGEMYLPRGDRDAYGDLMRGAGLRGGVPSQCSPGVRLAQHDASAASDRYVAFREYGLVGRDPQSVLHLPSADVALHHARLIRLGDLLWLEPLQASYATRLDGQVVPLGHLVPLTPHTLLALGDVEFVVAHPDSAEVSS